MTALRVRSLHLYPVKSLAGIALAASPVDERGLSGDRRWAVVDVDGAKVTAREVHAMLGLRAEPLDATTGFADVDDSGDSGDNSGDGSNGQAGGIRLVDRAGEVLVVAAPVDAAPVPVGFSGLTHARPAGDAAARWLGERLGRDVRLVWQGDDAVRPIRAEMGGLAGETNSLADAAPVHVTTDASLARLNDWLADGGSDPLGHDRFRPNIVVDGDLPFDEDDWRRVRIGGVLFRHTMVCDRCVMTTIDRETLASAKEPIRTLARHRRWSGATWFGVRLTPQLPLATDAALQVGDEVVVTERVSP